jgi:His/Glu/Gln/Arg/opine family amino acid ABC transporter permease subunit
MKLDFAVISNNSRQFVDGFLVTLWICSASLVLAGALGALVALARMSRIKILNWLAVTYIEVFRNVPFMIQVFLFYYALPFYGIRLPPKTIGILALAVFAGAYYAEIIRGAILAVPRGQMESARATGMSYLQAMRHVIFPQMVGYLIPPATNQTTSLVKESSVLSTITIAELTMTAERIQLDTYSFIEPLIVIALVYWACNALLSWLARRLEQWVQPSRGRSVAALRTVDSSKSYSVS